jgi:hypothetical protein
LHLAASRPDRPSVDTKLTRSGALLIAAALITLAVGLIQTREKDGYRRNVSGDRVAMTRALGAHPVLR